MHIPRFMRPVNRLITNPVMGTFAWLVPPLAVVHHRGRKSGRPYRTPVIAFRTAGGFVIPMTYGRDVDWARNMVAVGQAEIERLGARTTVRNARIVGIEKAAMDLPAGTRGLFRLADLPGYVLVEDAR